MQLIMRGYYIHAITEFVLFETENKSLEVIVSSHSRKFKFKVFSIVHLNDDNF